MSYEFYISRANNYLNNKDNEITSDEWLNIVSVDPELKIDVENGDYFAVWSGQSKYEVPWLDWNQGNIYTKNPDKGLLGKMLQISTMLNATVQDEEGEVYHSVEDISEPPGRVLTKSNNISPLERIERKNRIVEIILIALVITGWAIWRNWTK